MPVLAVEKEILRMFEQYVYTLPESGMELCRILTLMLFNRGDTTQLVIVW
jgi:hypothetical protein